MDKEELAQIVKKVQKDSAQFELLYVKVIKKVYFWSYNIIKNEDLAKELAQESMIRIYQKLYTLKNTDGIISWMYVLVRNVCMSYLRSQKNKDKFFLSSDEFVSTYEQNIKEERRENLPDESYDLKETKNLIIKFIKNLPLKQREVIILFYLEEYKIDEISKILNYNVGSIKSRLHAGRKSLEQQIKKYQEENNVKLYSTTLLPLLGLLLVEYQDEIFNKQNLVFDSNLYQKKKISKIESLKKIFSNALSNISYLTVIVSVVAIIGYIDYQIKHNEAPQTIVVTDKPKEVGEINTNIKNNPYIASIRYMSFPVKTSVDVTVQLKEDVTKEKIHIFIGEREIAFEKIENKLIASVNENGEYTIVINNKKATFDINVIDPDAPELLEVKNYKDYLQLIIVDKKKQVNFEKSFVLYNDQVFEISDNLRVYGSFKGNLHVKIFTMDNRYIQYDIIL